MHIALVISSLSCGGAERVMSTMANYWVGRNNEVSLITLDSRNSDFYILHPNIKRYALDVMHESTSMLRAAKNNLSRIKKLRSAIRQSTPEVIISFMDTTNVLTLLATRGMGLEVIVSERVDISQYSIGMIESWLRRLTYTWASAVVVQTDSVSQWVKLNLKCNNVAVIPNPILMEKVTYNKSILADMINDYRG